MTGPDEVWQNVIAVCLLLFIIYITYCNYLFMQFASKLVIYELLRFFMYISYFPYLFMQVASKLVICELLHFIFYFFMYISYCPTYLCNLPPNW